MATITKQTSTEKGFGSAILSDQVKTHANDPFVVKKVAKAMETLKKWDCPMPHPSRPLKSYVDKQ